MRSIIIAPALVALALATPVQKRDDPSSQETEVSAQVSVAVAIAPPVARPAPAKIPVSDDAATSDPVIIPDFDLTNSTLPADTVFGDDEEDMDDDDDDDDSEQNEKRDEKSNKASNYRAAAIKRHNQHRANHGAGPLEWSTELADAAMKSAQRCTFAHFMDENGLQYGQNLALGYAAPNIAGIITDGWYSEVKDYANNYGQAQPDYGPNMSNFAKWGHFTQVVWKDTTKVGCATWRCKSVKTSASDSTPMPAAYGGDVTYCNYQSPGNYGGEYANNVGRPKKNQDIDPKQGVDQAKIAKFYSKRTGQKWKN